MDELLDVVELLAGGKPLPERLMDHALAGEWRDFRDCHIRPDWLLIYRLEPARLVLVRTVSHSELVKK